METKPPLPEAGKTEEQPLELLKREDVRTMAKDIALLREGEAKVERGRIGNLPTAEKPASAKQTEPQAPATVQEGSSASAPEALAVFSMPASPAGGPESGAAKSPRLGKLFIRILLVLVILFVVVNAVALTFFLLSKNQGEQTPSPQPSPVAPEPLRVPAPLFPIALAEQVNLGKNGGLVEALEQTLQRERSTGLTRVVLTVPEENRVWNAKEFLSSLGVEAPEGIASNLQENLTFFVYKNAQNRSRLGFAIPLAENANIGAGLTAWEPTMERNFALFFSIQGQKDSFAVTFFRGTVYKGVTVRFQTLSSQDLGLVYALLDNMLVVTSSFERMRAVIDQIQK